MSMAKQSTIVVKKNITLFNILQCRLNIPIEITE